MAGLVTALPAVARDNPWSQIAMASPGTAKVLGGPASGCIAGAKPLPLDGIGYQVVRVSRNRYWGHPTTLEFVQTLGRQAQAAGMATLYIGDLGQPRGGPMPWGHASHQNWLDVDVWFNLAPKPNRPPAAREEIETPSLVASGGQEIDRNRWTTKHRDLLRLAATAPRVERIFVNAVIKQQLCAELPEGPARAWLHKIRPWRGHDEHFHVRLNCPANDKECVAGKPIPPGDGCDEVVGWLRPVSPPSVTAMIPKPAPPAPRPAQPAACKALLGGDLARRP